MHETLVFSWPFAARKCPLRNEDNREREKMRIHRNTNHKHRTENKRASNPPPPLANKTSVDAVIQEKRKKGEKERDRGKRPGQGINGKQVLTREFVQPTGRVASAFFLVLCLHTEYNQPALFIFLICSRPLSVRFDVCSLSWYYFQSFPFHSSFLQLFSTSCCFTVFFYAVLQGWSREENTSWPVGSVCLVYLGDFYQKTLFVDSKEDRPSKQLAHNRRNQRPLNRTTATNKATSLSGNTRRGRPSTRNTFAQMRSRPVSTVSTFLPMKSQYAQKKRKRKEGEITNKRSAGLTTGTVKMIDRGQEVGRYRKINTMR